MRVHYWAALACRIQHVARCSLPDYRNRKQATRQAMPHTRRIGGSLSHLARILHAARYIISCSRCFQPVTRAREAGFAQQLGQVRHPSQKGVVGFFSS